MDTAEMITQFTWPMAFTVVASIITIVLGLKALFLKKSKDNHNADLEKDHTLITPNIQSIHDRVSSLKKEIHELDTRVQVMESKLDGHTKNIKDHEARDIADFNDLKARVDKIMQIIVEMLKS